MIVTRMRQTVERGRFRIDHYRAQQAPLDMLAQDAGHAWRYARAAFAERLHAELSLLAELLEDVGRAAERAAYDGWITAGRQWEDGLGVAPGSPESRFGRSHLSYEPCTPACGCSIADADAES